VARPLAGVSGVTIQGPALYVDNMFGGLFAVPDGISYGGGVLNVLGTPGGDVINVLNEVNVTVDGVQELVQSQPPTSHDVAVRVVGDAADRITLSDSQVPPPFASGPVFIGRPTRSEYDSFSNVEVYGFGIVTASRAIGAFLYDSAGDDTLIGVPSGGGPKATLSGPGYSLEVSTLPHFNGIQVYSSGGNDVAYLFDSGLNDTLTASPRGAYLNSEDASPITFSFSRPSYRITVYDFPTVRVYATAGGRDGANLTDSAGADVFVATPTYSYLAGNGYMVFVSGFAQVSAISSGGGDTAYFLDSAGNDLFRGTPAYAFLAGTGFTNGAIGFGTVVASAGAGGNDTADLYDSAGDDTFVGQGSSGVLAGPGYSLAVNGFATVRATSSAGGTDHLVLGTIDYAFQPLGNWQ
jgi:hypothetical protein